jgi:single-strand DNA-binding protein
MSINKVILSGNLAHDPEVRYTQAGKAVATFSLAVNDGWGENKKSYFHKVVVWGKIAETVGNNLHKGSKVGVTGKLTSRSYDGKDGQKRYVTEVVADMYDGIEFLDRKPQGEQNAPQAQDMGGEPVSEEIIPF